MAKEIYQNIIMIVFQYMMVSIQMEKEMGKEMIVMLIQIQPFLENI